MVHAISLKYIELRIKKKPQKLNMKPGKTTVLFPVQPMTITKKELKVAVKISMLNNGLSQKNCANNYGRNTPLISYFWKLARSRKIETKLHSHPVDRKKQKRNLQQKIPQIKKINQRLTKGHPHKKERVNPKPPKINQVA